MVGDWNSDVCSYDLVESAAHELEGAKRRTGGRQASVAFVDFTSDGHQPPTGRDVLTLAGLHDIDPLLSGLAQVPGGQRSTLLAQLRHVSDLESAVTSGHVRVVVDDDRGEPAVEALARRVVDLGNLAVWRAVTWIPGATHPEPDAEPDATQIRDALLNNPVARQRLRGRLDLARWWPPAPGMGERSAP